MSDIPIGTEPQRDSAKKIGKLVGELNEEFTVAIALGLEVELDYQELERVVGRAPVPQIRCRLLGEVKP